jgi:CheY-like chemotaxis protein
MDVQMPVLDGIGATKLIRDDEVKNNKPRQPIIALTAGAFNEDRSACIAAGMDDFLTKPVNIRLLIEKINEWADLTAI